MWSSLFSLEVQFAFSGLDLFVSLTLLFSTDVTFNIKRNPTVSTQNQFPPLPCNKGEGPVKWLATQRYTGVASGQMLYQQESGNNKIAHSTNGVRQKCTASQRETAIYRGEGST